MQYINYYSDYVIMLRYYPMYTFKLADMHISFLHAVQERRSPQLSRMTVVQLLGNSTLK